MILNHLKEIRMKEYMMSKREFAAMLDIAEQQYLRYESGKVCPTLEIALKVSNVLHKSVNEIWSFSSVSTQKHD